MKILAYDSETTGLPDWKAPSEAPQQPHIVQLAGLLCDDATGKVLSSIDLIVRPEGWEIPADVAEVHGITHEMAMDLGVSERTAVEALIELHKVADTRLGHNERFDMRIVRIALMRYPGLMCEDAWKEAKGECTGLLTKNIMCMEPRNRFGYKMPKLGEAYEHFIGKPLENAHSAYADAKACWDVYMAVKSQVAQEVANG